MQNLPLISVIMPTYNSACFIAEAIESVIGQTYSNWELIIIDDASTDDTRQIVQSFEDQRIQYVPLSQQQGYPSKVRNIGLLKAQGVFIGFLDSDDVFYPDALMVLFEALSAHSNCLIVQGYEVLMSEDGRKLKPNRAITATSNNKWHFTKAHRPASLEALLKCQNPYLLGSTLLRKEALEQVGFLNEVLMSGEDQEYFLRAYLYMSASAQSNPIGVVPAPIYKYRQRQNSLVRNIEKKDQAIQDNIRLLDWFFDPSHQLPPEIQKIQGEIYSNRYAYAAQSLLLDGYTEQARKWVIRAWQSPKSSKRHWFRVLLPILFRSLLPLPLNHQWHQWHQWSREIFYKARVGNA